MENFQELSLTTSTTRNVWKCMPHIWFEKHKRQGLTTNNLNTKKIGGAFTTWKRNLGITNDLVPEERTQWLKCFLVGQTIKVRPWKPTHQVQVAFWKLKEKQPTAKNQLYPLNNFSLSAHRIRNGLPTHGNNPCQLFSAIH